MGAKSAATHFAVGKQCSNRIKKWGRKAPPQSQNDGKKRPHFRITRGFRGICPLTGSHQGRDVSDAYLAVAGG